MHSPIDSFWPKCLSLSMCACVNKYVPIHACISVFVCACVNVVSAVWNILEVLTAYASIPVTTGHQ